MSRATAATESPPSAGRTIGEILLARRLITHVELEEAVAAQQATGKPLGQILVETDAITRLELASALAEQWGDAGTISPTFPGGSDYVDPLKGTDAALHVEELRAERRALEARLLEFERAGVDSQWQQELSSALQALFARVEGAEAALGELQARDPASHLGELQAVLVELSKHAESVDTQLAALGERAHESASASAVQDGLAEVAARIEALVPRIDGAEVRAGALSTRMDELSGLVAQALTELRQTAQDAAQTQAELAGRVDGVPTLDAVQSLAAALAELHSSVEALAARPAGDPALADRLDSIAAALESRAGSAALAELADRVAELADRPTADPALSARVEELARLVEEVADRPAADPSLAARLDELAERLDLGAGAVSDEGEPDPRVDALIARVAELSARPTSDPEVQERLEVVSARLDELTPRPAADPEVEERLGAVSVRLDELAARPAADPEVAARLDDLASRLDQLQLAPAAAADDPTGRLNELAAAVEALRSAPPAAAEAPGAGAVEVSERLEAVDVAARGIAQELVRATEAWSVERRELEARIDMLAARLDGELVAASTAAPPPPQGDGRAPAADGDVERLRMAVERLMLDFAEHRRAISAAVPSRDLDDRLRRLTEQVESLNGSAPVASAAGAPSDGGDLPAAGELRSLSTRLEEMEAAAVATKETMLARLERMMGTIDWRLQRLENPEP